MTSYRSYEASSRSGLTAGEIHAYLHLAHAIVLQTIKDSKRDDYYAADARAFLESPNGGAIIGTLLDLAQSTHDPARPVGLRISDILAQ